MPSQRTYTPRFVGLLVVLMLQGCGGGSGRGGGVILPPPPPPPPPPPVSGYKSPMTIGLERLRTESQVPINVSFDKGVPRWIRLDIPMTGNSAEEGARNFLVNYQDLLGQESLIEETDRRQLSFATRHTTREEAPEAFDFVRFAQSYDGVPVFGAEAIVGVLKGDSADGRIVTMSGRFMGAPRSPIDLIPAI